MKLLLFLIGIIKISNVVQCHDSDSAEGNAIEMNPIYDTIIFRDIADVINEFENDVNSPLDAVVNSSSESDENIEGLLSEYQHYLEKAHKQRKGILEKSKPKNKVPILRHERYIKTMPGAGAKYNDYFYNTGYYNPNGVKFPQTQYNNPLDLFIPLNSKAKYPTISEIPTILPKNTRENTNFEKRPLNFSTKSLYEPIKSSCFCKNKQIPYECSCKQCLMPFETIPSKSLSVETKKPIQNPYFVDTPFRNQDFTSNNFRDLSENTLNIRIKVDLSLPKIPNNFEKYHANNRDKTIEPRDGYSKEFTSNINLPLPFVNIPIPMEMFGYTKTSKIFKQDATPMHKITIHKKKKSRNTNIKKNRKKLITFHNIQLQPQHFQDHIADNLNITHHKSNNKIQSTSETNTTVKMESISTTKNANELININETQTEESIYLTVNITSNSDNTTEDYHKSENSIETEYSTKKMANLTTEKPIILRKKREIISFNNTVQFKKNVSLTHISLPSVKVTNSILKTAKQKNDTRKSEKSLADKELLYWPSNNNNRSDIHSKNITMIIYETENKKAKLNISRETIRRNHTHALEQAIFGKVDWNNINAVAPTFMSFVGKYLNGALTFCSQTICHSMKCADKICVHRICVPEERINNKGHCAKSNNMDTVASMESIMDLPSNIAFEIVDILQDKMLGKIFGKVTLCISTKCITFASTKKIFVKSKCTIKYLSSTGHCLNSKNVKIM